MGSLAGRRNYILLSAFVFCFFFAQAASISLLSIWLTQTLHLSGVQVGTVFSANFVAAMISQPVYGYISDRMGFRRVVPAAIAILVVFAGVFFTFVYGPLLRTDVLAGAVVGGAYIGITFVAGSYAVESYVDRVSRRDGFEYSRARLWGSLGFASAALFSGRLYNLDPRINFFMASAAGLLLLPLIFAARTQDGVSSDAPRASLRLGDSLAVLRMPRFWGFMVLILGVTDLYLVYDQQFPFYFSSLFPTRLMGNAMFGEASIRNNTGHQTSVRGLAKCQLLVGIVIALTQAVKSDSHVHVQQQLGELLAYLPLIEGAIVLSEQNAEPTGRGAVRPAYAPLQALRLLIPKFYERIVQVTQTLAAGGLLISPTEADLRSPIGPDIARYYKGAGVEAEERIRLFKLAWDATGTQFGQRMLHYERYYAGDPVRVSAAYHAAYDVTPLLAMVQRALKATG